MSDNPASPKLSLPLLITRGLIVFPNMSETIEVSRLFSMAAVDQAKNVTNSLIFIVSQSKQEIEEPTEKDVFDVGTLCRIINYVSQNKSYRIRVVGSKRVKLSNIHPRTATTWPMEKSSPISKAIKMPSSNWSARSFRP
jgi:ATP-dependent Lon protease